MKILLLIGAVISVSFRSIHTTTIIFDHPINEQRFITSKSPGNYDANADPFDKLSVEKRAQMCHIVIQSPKYIYCNATNTLHDYPDIDIIKNYQLDSASDKNIPKEENKLDDIGIKVGYVVLQLNIKRFFCGKIDMRHVNPGEYRELYLSSGLTKDISFILARNKPYEYLRIYGVLDSNELTEAATSAIEIPQLINDVAKNPKSLCEKEISKYEICSRIHNAVLWSDSYPEVDDEDKHDPYLSEYFWLNQERKDCKKRKVIVEEREQNVQLTSVETMACQFNGFECKFAEIFVSLKSEEGNSVVVVVMIPKAVIYDGEKSPLLVKGSFEFTLKF